MTAETVCQAIWFWACIEYLSEHVEIDKKFICTSPLIKCIVLVKHEKSHTREVEFLIKISFCCNSKIFYIFERFLLEIKIFNRNQWNLIFCSFHTAVEFWVHTWCFFLFFLVSAIAEQTSYKAHCPYVCMYVCVSQIFNRQKLKL